LNCEHRFLMGVRRQLQQQAAESALLPMDATRHVDVDTADETDVPLAKPTLDVNHGFYLGIRRHLQRDAEELGIRPWGSGSPSTDTARQPIAVGEAQPPTGRLINVENM